MKFNDCYLHAISVHSVKTFDGKKSLEILESILKSGELKSSRLRGIKKSSTSGWNGLDYISLCDYSSINDQPYNNDMYLSGYNSYNTFIINSLSLIIDKNDIKVIKPQLVEPIIFDYNLAYEMNYLGNSKKNRYSDLFDEVQVKNQISIDKIVGVTVPISYMINERKNETLFKKNDEYNVFSREELIDYLNEIKQILQKYNIPNALYDVDTKMDINIPENLDKVYEYAKKI